MDYSGLLLIDKPVGWTSFDVVAKVRGTLKKEVGERVKVGHTGTLDPLASGLMIVVVGSYCKRAGEFSTLSKTYQAVMKLGQNSSTGDKEGEKLYVSSKKPKLDELQAVCNTFIGIITQTPPAYSAIKINGERAYNLARQGKKVEIEPRKIHIYSLIVSSYTYPYVEFSTSVSSGTYIRSLAEDIGKKLGTGAYLTELKRTKVGVYTIEQARHPNEEELSKYLINR